MTPTDSLVEWELFGGTAIRKWVSLFAGIGALLVGGALSALPSIYPNQIAHHPKIVVGCLIAGVVLFLLEGVVRTNPPEPTPASTSSAQAKSELHLHINQPAPPPVPTPKPSVPARSVLPVPQFAIQLTEARVVVGEYSVQFLEPEEEGGEKCLLLHVTNKPADEGHQTRPAHCVFATLDFTVGSRATTVNRACWIGNESNETRIDLSETVHIVVGMPKEDEWVTYNNPNRIRLNLREHWNPPDVLERRTVNWGQGAHYTVDVRIISNDRGATLGQTFAHRQFTLEHKGISYSATMLE